MWVLWCIHTHAALGWDGMRWDEMGYAVLCVATRCCVFHVYMNIHIYKNDEDEDDDALMLSEYQKRDHAYF